MNSTASIASFEHKEVVKTEDFSGRQTIGDDVLYTTNLPVQSIKSTHRWYLKKRSAQRTTLRESGLEQDIVAAHSVVV